MNRPDARAVRIGRLKLLLVLAIFAAPSATAWLLFHAGWQPGVKSHGLPVLPQRNFQSEHLQVALDGGGMWPWRAATPRLTLVALPGPTCADRCFAALTGMAKARLMLANNRSRLRLLYVGMPPADPAAVTAMKNYWQLGSDVDHRLDAYRPRRPDSVSALLVESNGTVLSRYPAGFDVSGLLQDMRKVIH
ncbi:hypothetical protein [Dyella sp. A6]|uniref:hypothetical protein n=1 Tax=Dyella aluminiiresistens TaxID=3069105 RepID=UPI002E77F813|nr:hypothetical protein [Dyella sp. A6]